MTIDAETLRTIHRLHIQLSDLRGRLEKGPKQVRAGEARVQRLNSDLDAAKEVYKRTRMTIDDKELSLKSRENNILDVRARLNSCSSNKEYQAFIEQIAADEQANSVLSDEIIELLDKSSTDEGAVQEAEKEVAAGKAELDKTKQRVADEKGQLESEVARIEGELAGAEEALPAEVRDEYQRAVRAHGEDALAPIEDECCGGCFQRITPQMIAELAMSMVVFCKTCGRLLYIPEDTTVS